MQWSIIYYIILHQIQHQINDFLIIVKVKTIVLLKKQILKQIWVTYFNKKEKPINKVRKINVICDNNIKIANKVILESVH